MQFLEEDPVLFGEGISNAPKARVYGLELESDWAPTAHLRLNGSFSWLEGEFTADYLALDPRAADDAQRAAGFPDYLFWTNFFAASVARDGARRNISGNSVPKLPRWQEQSRAHLYRRDRHRQAHGTRAICLSRRATSIACSMTAPSTRRPPTTR